MRFNSRWLHLDPRTMSVWALLYLLAGAGPVAGDDSDYLDLRSTSVPPYCDPGLSRAEKQKWNEKLGKTGGGLSHYCQGLFGIEAIRSGELAHRKDSKELRTARTSVKQINYFLKRLPKDHPMMPEVLRNLAQAYKYAGQEEQARAVLASIGENGAAPGATPGMAPRSFSSASAGAAPYVRMADQMMSKGLPGEAVELLELALRLDPDSGIIKAKLARAKAASGR